MAFKTRKILFALLLLMLASVSHARIYVDAVWSGKYGTDGSTTVWGTRFNTPQEACAAIQRTFKPNGIAASSLKSDRAAWVGSIGTCITDPESWVYPLVGLHFDCPAGAKQDSWSGQCYLESCPEGQTLYALSGTCVIKKDRYHPATCQPAFGNSIYPMTGTRRQQEVLGQWLGLEIAAVYDTSSQAPSNLPDARYNPQPTPSFGAMWQSTAHRKLVLQGMGSARPAVQVPRGGGRWVSFAGNGAGRYVPDADVNDQLVPIAGGGWRYLDARGQAQETYDATGNLTDIDRADGTKLKFHYSAAVGTGAPAVGLLMKIEDVNSGRKIQFAYEQPATPPDGTSPAPRLQTLTGPASELVKFDYNTAGHLRLITWPDARAREFRYEDTRFPWALTGLIDESGKLIGKYGYDDQGRAVATERGDGLDAYSVTYGSGPSWKITESLDPDQATLWRDHWWVGPADTQVQLPNQTWLSLQFVDVLGVPRPARQSQPAGAGCTASSSALTYDAHANVTQRDDFNGNRSCHGYDMARNLETSRVEGLDKTAVCGDLTKDGAKLPIGSRKTATAWHPDWRLETKRTEPRRITRYVYNGQPDPLNGNAVLNCAPAEAKLADGKPIAVLCKKVEQASTDTTGSAGLSAVRDGSVPNRVWSYTYNAAGQVLTEIDPLGKVTKYAYYDTTTADYTKGDLKSVTNPASQVTTFTKYNKHGQVLESGDPNKLLTVNTYDDRQRLKTASVGGLLTTYDYWPNGLLRQVTQPDASFLSYEYDAAQRLRVVKDQLGNRIDYTPDSAGNNKLETLTDPSGVLRRQLKRDFDALNRLQQATGRE